MAKPTKREYELVGTVLAQDKEIEALKKRLSAALELANQWRTKYYDLVHRTDDSQGVIDDIPF